MRLITPIGDGCAGVCDLRVRITRQHIGWIRGSEIEKWRTGAAPFFDETSKDVWRNRSGQPPRVQAQEYSQSTTRLPRSMGRHHTKKQSSGEAHRRPIAIRLYPALECPIPAPPTFAVHRGSSLPASACPTPAGSRLPERSGGLSASERGNSKTELVPLTSARK